MGLSDTKLHPVTGPAAWTAAEMRRQENRWTIILNEAQRQDLDRALEPYRNTAPRYERITRETFPLPSWQPLFAELSNELLHGRGFAMIRGWNVSQSSHDEARIAFWGICAHLGRGVTQTAAGELVCDIIDKGAPSDPLQRTFATSQAAPFHVDSSDVVGLLCLRRAKSGGASLICSAAAVYNRILQTRPDLLPVLMRGYERDRRGEHGPGEDPVGPRIPVFALQDGRLLSRFNPTFIRAAATRRNQPLGALEQEAFELMSATLRAGDLMLEMDFQPGDIQLLNNYAIVHSRTGFEDHADPARARLLLRLWFEMEAFERIVPDREMRFGQIRYGNLGLDAEQWARRRN